MVTVLAKGTNGSELTYGVLLGESTNLFLTLSDWLENYEMFPTFAMILKIIFMVSFIVLRTTLGYTYMVNT